MRRQLLLMLVLCGMAYAQAGLDTLPGFFAGSGPRGIYVVWQGPAMSSWNPTGEGYIGFNVYRKGGTDKEFRKINPRVVSTVESASEMKGILGARLPLWQLFLKAPDADSVYRIVRNSPQKIRAWAAFDVNMLQVLGIAYLDRDIKRGEKYTYRIALVKKDGSETAPSGEFLVEAGKPPRQLFGPINLKAKGGDRSVEIKWNPNPKDTMGFVYNVYRATKERGEYLLITERPIAIFATEEQKGALEGTFVDNDVVNGITYYYKLTSLDFLENESPLVGPVSATPKDLTPPPPPQHPVAVGSVRGIAISWEKSKANDVKGYWIYRAKKFDGEYTRLSTIPVPPDTGLYEDVTVEANKQYFYKITAIDFSGNESEPSAPCFSSFQNYVPPLPPQNVKAEATAPKEITISWNPNTEKDLKGYYVFRAFRPDGKFEQISHLIPKDTTSFKDKDKTLSAKSTYFYAVTAINQTGVMSAYSSVAVVQAMDTTGPMQPLGFHGWWDKAGVHLLWDPSMDPTTSGWAIYKAEGKVRSNKLSDYTLIKTLQENFKSFIDTDVKRGKSYTYRLVAVNSDGYMSEPTPPLTIFTGGATKNPPSIIRLLKKKDGILVTWDGTRENAVKGYIIYKSVGGATYSKLTELDVNSTSFLDKDVKKGELYYYYITTFDENKKEGLPSNRISITY